MDTKCDLTKNLLISNTKNPRLLRFSGNGPSYPSPAGNAWYFLAKSIWWLTLDVQRESTCKHCLARSKNLGHSVTVRWVASTCATGSLCQKRPWTQNVIQQRTSWYPTVSNAWNYQVCVCLEIVVPVQALQNACSCGQCHSLLINFNLVTDIWRSNRKAHLVIWIWSNADVCRCWKYNPCSKWLQTSQFHWWKKMILTCLCLCHETTGKAITHNLIALLIHALKCHGPASRQLATVLGIPKNLGASVTVRWVASTCATGSLCQKRPWTQNVI